IDVFERLHKGRRPQQHKIVTLSRYAGAGLTIAADRAIPALGPLACSGSVDLTIHTASVPIAWDTSSETVYSSDPESDGGPQVNVSRSRVGHRFEYGDGTRFWIDTAAEHVWMSWD